MKRAQWFELMSILGTVAMIVGLGVRELKGRQPVAYGSVQRKAADVKRDMFWSASQYAAGLTLSTLRERALTDPETPFESVLRPTPDPLAELNKNL